MEEIRVPITEDWESRRPKSRKAVPVAPTVAPFRGTDRRVSSKVGARSEESAPRQLIFCHRCRGMIVGANLRYVIHCLRCRGRLSEALRISIYAAIAALVVFILPTTTAPVSSQRSETGLGAHLERARGAGAAPRHDPALPAIADLFERYSRISDDDRERVSQAVVASARRYDVDPFLVASILVVESSGDAFAISPRDAVGIMQIHVPTWAPLVDLEGINLFRVEDNIDLGTRILKEYTDQYGLWGGVIRYLGAGDATEQAMDYLARVQEIYGERSPDRSVDGPVRRIVIDAGHGGQDAGSVGPSGLTEKELVLDIAKRLKAGIESGIGAQVVLTRNADIFVPLEGRAAIANQVGADLFVSIHANSSKTRSIRGFETYFLSYTTSREGLELAARESATSRSSIAELQDRVRRILLQDVVDDSRRFAGHVQSALAGAMPSGRDRGVKPAPFAVLVGARMPSILAEVSFISNPEDEDLLRDEDYRQQIADALFEGIRSYSRALDDFSSAGTRD